MYCPEPHLGQYKQQFQIQRICSISDCRTEYYPFAEYGADAKYSGNSRPCIHTGTACFKRRI